MDETKLENKLACFFSKVKKLVTDYMAYCDMAIKKAEKASSVGSRIAYIDLFSANWQGAASPYSQVVDVAGATKNSQVDLTPSVEQLSIFRNKDLAFVTENEGGVVTVYAIGQKPTNDYTIQVTITEVAR